MKMAPVKGLCAQHRVRSDGKKKRKKSSILKTMLDTATDQLQELRKIREKEFPQSDGARKDADMETADPRVANVSKCQEEAHRQPTIQRIQSNICKRARERKREVV